MDKEQKKYAINEIANLLKSYYDRMPGEFNQVMVSDKVDSAVFMLHKLAKLRGGNDR